MYQQTAFAGKCHSAEELGKKRQNQGKILNIKWDAAEGQKEIKEPTKSVARNGTEFYM